MPLAGEADLYLRPAPVPGPDQKPCVRLCWSADAGRCEEGQAHPVLLHL